MDLHSLQRQLLRQCAEDLDVMTTERNRYRLWARAKKRSLISQLEIISRFSDAQTGTIAVMRSEIQRLIEENTSLYSRIDSIQADLQAAESNLRQR